MNDQSVTTISLAGGQRELDSVGGFGEPARDRRSPNKMRLPAWRQWTAIGREPQMVGGRMDRSLDDVKQGTTADGNAGARRGQSIHSSEETGNDRGAKGCRKVEPCDGTNEYTDLA